MAGTFRRYSDLSCPPTIQRFAAPNDADLFNMLQERFKELLADDWDVSTRAGLDHFAQFAGMVPGLARGHALGVISYGCTLLATAVPHGRQELPIAILDTCYAFFHYIGVGKIDYGLTYHEAVVRARTARRSLDAKIMKALSIGRSDDARWLGVADQLVTWEFARQWINCDSNVIYVAMKLTAKIAPPSQTPAMHYMRALGPSFGCKQCPSINTVMTWTELVCYY